jgi:hypothetical protein
MTKRVIADSKSDCSGCVGRNSLRAKSSVVDPDPVDP